MVLPGCTSTDSSIIARQRQRRAWKKSSQHSVLSGCTLPSYQAKERRAMRGSDLVLHSCTAPGPPKSVPSSQTITPSHNHRWKRTKTHPVFPANRCAGRSWASENARPSKRLFAPGPAPRSALGIPAAPRTPVKPKRRAAARASEPRPGVAPSGSW